MGRMNLGTGPHILLVAIAMVPVPVSAGETSPGLISDVQVQADNRTIFQVNGTDSGKPACAIYSRYIVDLTTPAGSAIFSQVLSAQAAGRQIRVYGKGVCDLIAGHESVWSVRDAP